MTDEKKDKDTQPSNTPEGDKSADATDGNKAKEKAGDKPTEAKAEGKTEGEKANDKPVEKKHDSEKPVEPKADDKKPDEAKADDKKPDEAKADDKKPDEAKADEKKPDEAKGDDKKADEAKADDKKPDEAKPDEAKADDKKADDKKPDEAKADDKKPDEAKADDKKPDEAKADDKKPDEAKADDKKPDEAKADDKKPDEAKADDKKADEAKADDKKADDKKPDDKPLTAEQRREQMEAEIRKRLEQELTERHGETVATLSSGAATPAEPVPAKAKKPAGGKGKRKPVKRGPKRELTEEEKKAVKIRDGKVEIEAKLRKRMYMAYLGVSLFCFGGFGLWYFTKEKPKPAPVPVDNGEVVGDVWIDRSGNKTSSGTTQQSTTQQPARMSRKMEALMKRVEGRVAASDQLGAIDELKNHAMLNPDDSKMVDREIRSIRAEYPNETGEGRFWEFKKEDFHELVNAQTKESYIEAAKMLVTFKNKHKEERAVAVYWLTRIQGDYMKLFHDVLPVNDPSNRRKKKKQEDDYGDWGGGAQVDDEDEDTPVWTPEPTQDAKDGKAAPIDLDEAWE